MAGISLERKTVGPRLFLCVLAAGLILAPRSGFAQSAAVSVSEGAPASVQFQVLDQRVVSFGQHTITLNRVAPPVFRTPVSTPTPAPEQPFANYLFLFFFATVYDGQYTVIQWPYGDQDVVAVSNIDFDYLATSNGFASGDTFYAVIAALDDESSAKADPETSAWLARARGALPSGAPGYLIVSGTGSPDMIQGLNALDAYFGANGSMLVQRYLLRQAQDAAQLQELKLHPLVRPNTVINFWPIKTSAYPTGSNQ
jgi:hypothetical protein